ncbi:hypothetical protein SteCoe_12978 [Stentor coeruleus]|uniref:Uncharacterized protein n=1 Tax=Stentor coeruleus TaxID=5963 RepID=A0A1R2C9E6_9CILI|nr:hypothetical protein SteCoe_12978 [Stentor coeruleus]
MGSEWSCPCADREKIRRRLPAEHITESGENETKLTLHIKPILPKKLEKAIKAPLNDYVLSSISKHPTQNKPLLIYQRHSDVEYSYSSENSFKLFQQPFDTSSSLAESVKEKCSAGYVLIGGYSDSNKLQLVYYETKEKYERELVVIMEDFIDLPELKKIFTEHQDHLYIGSIEHNESVLLIFEKSVTPRPLKYLVADYPMTSDQEPDFEYTLEDTINECTSNKEVRFRGCLTFKTSLFLIFIQ